MARRGRARILITEANELAGLGAIRSLGRAGYEIGGPISETITSDATRWSRYAGAPLINPDPWKRHPAFRDWLAKQAKSGDWDLILPNSEAAIVAAAQVRAEGSGTVIAAPADTLLPYTLSKYAATEAAEKAAVPCPETKFFAELGSESQARSMLPDSRFPLILKTDNSTGKGGEYRKGQTYTAGTFEQAVYLLPELLENNERFIVQEKIRGFGVGAFLLMQQGLVRLRFAHRRLHEVPFTGGYSSFRESTADSEAIRLSEQLLRYIRYDGVAMVEFRREAGTGKTYFLEINGRLWGSIALALHAGVDFPVALVSSALGEPVEFEQPEYPVGLRCRHTPGEIAHVLSLWKGTEAQGATRTRKIRALGEFVRLSVDPRIRHDHFWWTDPLPGVYQAFDSARFVARRVGEAARAKLWKRGKARRLENVVAEQRGRSRPIRASKVLFLCYGNICRSPFAEEYWNRVVCARDGNLPAASSAGFYGGAGRSTPAKIASLARRSFGVELAEHRSRRVTEAMLGEADVVFVMDSENYEAIEREFPAARVNTFLLGVFGTAENDVEIEDPFLLTEPQRVAACFDRLKVALHGFEEALAGQHVKV